MRMFHLGRALLACGIMAMLAAPSAGAAVLENAMAADIGPHDAVLRANLSDLGGEDELEVSFRYREVTGGELAGDFVLKRHTIDDTIAEGDGQSIADIDGDGENNIIVGTGDGGAVYWYEKHSPYDWTRHLIAGGFIEVEGTLAADFNGDGQIEVIILDQATADPTQPNVYIAKQDTEDPTGPWSIAILDEDAPHVQQGIVHDVDGDGGLDFVYAYEGAGPDGGFYWMEYRGGDPLSANHWTKHEIEQVSGAWWIDYNSPKDFTGNGNEGDLLVSVREGRNRAYSDGTVAIYERPEDPRSGEWRKHTIEDGYVPLHVSSGDLSGNGDGRDIVSAGSHDGGEGLYWYEFGEWRRHVIEVEGDWWGTYAFDINNSGRAEIITGKRYDDVLRIYAYDTASEQYNVVAEDGFHKPDDQIIFDDITGDGHKTEFFVGQDPGGIFWYQAFELAWDETERITLTETGEFEVQIDGLTPNTQYQFKAVAEREDGPPIESSAGTFITDVQLARSP